MDCDRRPLCRAWKNLVRQASAYTQTQTQITDIDTQTEITDTNTHTETQTQTHTVITAYINRAGKVVS